jgi:asparagine synthase (glutamine-hydrolysing)
MHRDFQNRHADRNIYRPAGDLIEQQRLDIAKYSLPILLRYEDKNSMSHSVESRVPFLDHRLVEFALNLPSDHKFWGGKAKRVMRMALADALPAAILARRTKLGFGGTFASWVQALSKNFQGWIDSPHEAIDP